MKQNRLPLGPIIHLSARYYATNHEHVPRTIRRGIHLYFPCIDKEDAHFGTVSTVAASALVAVFPTPRLGIGYLQHHASASGCKYSAAFGMNHLNLITLFRTATFDLFSWNRELLESFCIHEIIPYRLGKDTGTDSVQCVPRPPLLRVECFLEHATGGHVFSFVRTKAAPLPGFVGTPIKKYCPSTSIHPVPEISRCCHKLLLLRVVVIVIFENTKVAISSVTYK